MSPAASNFLILLAMAGIVIFVLGWMQRAAAPRSLSALEKLAHELSFHYERPRWFGSGGDASGAISGANVRITIAGNQTFAISVDIGPPEGARIATHGLVDARATHRTGDDLFDRNVVVRGESPIPEAILSHPIRRRILAIREHATFTAESGRTHATLPSDDDTAVIAARVREIVDLSLALAQRPSTAAAVAENVAVEPDSTVRERNLEALLAHGDPASIEKGLDAALRDWRLKPIAMAMVPASHAELFAEPPEKSAARLTAISSALQIRAIGVLESAGVAAQPLLLALLRAAKDGEVELAVLHALASCGDVAAIPVLRARYGTADGTPAARTILAIQSRASGSPGGVSLAEASDQGALSIAREAGAVSIAKGPKG